MKRKIKILVTFIEAGMGHIVTAQSIYEALKQKKDDNIEVIDSYILHRTPLLKKYEDFLVEQTKLSSSNKFHSKSQFVAMKIFGPQTSLRFVHSTVYKKQRNAYVEELKKINPDIIIDTHYFAAHCACYYRDHFKKSVKVVTYNPDNNTHGWWDKNVDYFITNNDMATREAIEKLKIPKDRVKQVFFITRKAVAETDKPKEFYREKFNIPKDKFAVVLADGVYAKAKLPEFVDELLKSQKEMTIVAIAGKNKELYQKYTSEDMKVPPNITFLPFEFTPLAHEIYCACDLFITKGGPNAILDAVFMRTPILVNYCASDIERQTCKLFVNEYNCGVEIKDKKKAREFVENCIDNPKILQKYVQNEEKFDKNRNGATEIADFVLDLVKGK